jgi:hypothetical protein
MYSQDGLISEDARKKLDCVMKFACPRLARIIATFVIKIKPLQIVAAAKKYGKDHAKAAGSLLIVGPQCMPRTTK